MSKAWVRIGRGPEGYLLAMPRPKRALGGIVRGVPAEEAMAKIALGGCPHKQAATVELCTGEVVACICIACLDRLPENWITRQRDQAEREARCDHRELVMDLRMGVGVALHPKVCGECNARILWP